MRATVSQTAVALVAAASVTFAGLRVADACGCVSPPAVTEGDYAVNQQAEQIIFEVEPNYVTAHILIKYAGDPAAFAWIVPVPEAPEEMSISPAAAFGLLDDLTAPDVAVTVENLCPVSQWACRHHPDADCGGNFGDDDDVATVLDAGASSSDAGGGGGPPPVEVIDEQVVGDYQTVTFRASEAAAAAQWLRDNGFIVNATTTLYMESYVEANMVFVAAKLVPGAGVDAIKPLRLRFRAPFPSIPLVLTAVAAEPHLTVTAYVYASTPFRPMSHPVVAIDPARIAQDRGGRGNYPMVLARTIDEAGGDGFAIEYRGAPLRPSFGQGNACCESGWDFCNLGNNGLCECPRDDFEAKDCAPRGDLLDGIALLDDLANRYPSVTRITTRISPEEMRFDPTFEPGVAGVVDSFTGRMVARGQQASLAGCTDRVTNGDEDDFATIDAKQACAATYCGAGQCAMTAAAGGCACDAGTVARQFTDLDGKKSVTCIPAQPPVDLEAGGIDLPDACAGIDCGLGQCHDRNGVAVCTCNGGAAAVTEQSQRAPRCVAIAGFSGTPGAEDYSDGIRALDVCAAPVPACDVTGWYEQVQTPRLGVDCGDATPPAERLTPTPAPTCGDASNGLYGCGCQGTHPAGALALAWIVGFVLMRRRRAGTIRG
jgi:MYXO-CTERM domain-containing protein